MDSMELTPRSPLQRDVAALIGLLTVLEGELMASGTPAEVPEWATRLATRLHRDGLLPADADSQRMRQGLDDLNQRLRYVLGEYDSLPTTSPVP